MWKCHYVCNRGLRYLGALAVFFLESFSCIKTRFVGWLLCTFLRRQEIIFKISFLVIGPMKYGCCAHVLEIIQKIYLKWRYMLSVSNFTKNLNSFTRPPLCKECWNLGLFSRIWTESYPYFLWFCATMGKYRCDSVLIQICNYEIYNMYSIYINI